MAEKTEEVGDELLAGYMQEAPDAAGPFYRLAARTFTAEVGKWGPARSELMIVPPWPRHDWRTYDPLMEESGLFRTFADLQPTPEAYLVFANKYGSLGGSATGYTEGPHAPGLQGCGEPVRVWRAAISWMRCLVGLWEAAKAKDLPELSRRVYSRGGAFEFSDLPPERLADLPLARELRPDPELPPLRQVARRHTAIMHGRMDIHHAPEAAAGAFRRGDLAAGALLFCALAVNEAMDGLLRFRLAYDAGRAKPAGRIVPADLWGAMLFQFSMAIDGGRNYQRCPVCRRWFELSPGLNRANKLFCSPSCRTRSTLLKIKRAVHLHEEGRTVQEIAKEVGSEAKFVRKWVKGSAKKKEK